MLEFSFELDETPKFIDNLDSRIISLNIPFIHIGCLFFTYYSCSDDINKILKRWHMRWLQFDNEQSTNDYAPKLLRNFEFQDKCNSLRESTLNRLLNLMMNLLPTQANGFDRITNNKKTSILKNLRIPFCIVQHFFRIPHFTFRIIDRRIRSVKRRSDKTVIWFCWSISKWPLIDLKQFRGCECVSVGSMRWAKMCDILKSVQCLNLDAEPHFRTLHWVRCQCVCRHHLASVLLPHVKTWIFRFIYSWSILRWSFGAMRCVASNRQCTLYTIHCASFTPT